MALITSDCVAMRFLQFSSSCWNVGKNLDKLHKAQGVAHPIGAFCLGPT